MLSESSFIESSISIWSPDFLLSSPGFSNASPSTSPGFSRVRVFFGSESKSPESGPGFEVCHSIARDYIRHSIVKRSNNLFTIRTNERAKNSLSDRGNQSKTLLVLLRFVILIDFK